MTDDPDHIPLTLEEDERARRVVPWPGRGEAKPAIGECPTADLVAAMFNAPTMEERREAQAALRARYGDQPILEGDPPSPGGL